MANNDSTWNITWDTPSLVDALKRELAFRQEYLAQQRERTERRRQELAEWDEIDQQDD